MLTASVIGPSFQTRCWMLILKYRLFSATVFEDPRYLGNVNSPMATSYSILRVGFWLIVMAYRVGLSFRGSYSNTDFFSFPF